jgi:hypothetical protein
MLPVKVELAVTPSVGLQTQALDHVAAGIDLKLYTSAF